MPEAIIRDPKQNQGKEADFGVLMDVREGSFGKYCLYYKGPFASSNPRRYWTAGTEVNISGPVQKLDTIYLWDNQYNNMEIDCWVRVHPDPDSSTGPVVARINELINGSALPFPLDKEYLSDYTLDAELKEETDEYR